MKKVQHSLIICFVNGVTLSNEKNHKYFQLKAFSFYILSKEILLKLDQGKAQLHKMLLWLPKKAKTKENSRGY